MRECEIREFYDLAHEEFETKYSLKLHRQGIKHINYSIIKRKRLELGLYNLTKYTSERIAGFIKIFTNNESSRLLNTNYRSKLIIRLLISIFETMQEEENIYSTNSLVCDSIHS